MLVLVLVVLAVRKVPTPHLYINENQNSCRAGRWAHFMGPRGEVDLTRLPADRM